METGSVDNMLSFWHLKTKEMGHLIVTNGLMISTEHRSVSVLWFYLGGDAHGAWDVDAEEQQSVSSTRGVFIRTESKEAILVTAQRTLWYTGGAGRLPGLTEVAHVNL